MLHHEHNKIQYGVCINEDLYRKCTVNLTSKDFAPELEKTLAFLALPCRTIPILLGLCGSPFKRNLSK